MNNNVFRQITVIRVFPNFKCNLFYCSHCSVVQTPFGIEIFAFYCDFRSNAYWCVFDNAVYVKMSPCWFFLCPLRLSSLQRCWQQDSSHLIILPTFLNYVGVLVLLGYMHICLGNYTRVLKMRSVLPN